MWHRSENGVRPAELDTTSSKVYNIITKNVEEVTYTDEEGNEQTKYVYDEAFIKKEDWDVFETAMGAKNDTEDLAEAIEILTNIILEG